MRNPRPLSAGWPAATQGQAEVLLVVTGPEEPAGGIAGTGKGWEKAETGITAGEKGQGEARGEYEQRETGNPSGGRAAEGIRDEGQKSAGTEASLVPLIAEQFVYREVFWFVCCLPYKDEQVS